MKKRMMLLGLLALITSTVFGCSTSKMSEDETEVFPESLSWVRENVSISLNGGYGDNVYSVSKDDSILPYNENYRIVIDELMGELTSKDYAMDEPLIIYNPSVVRAEKTYPQPACLRRQGVCSVRVL